MFPFANVLPIWFNAFEIYSCIYSKLAKKHNISINSIQKRPLKGVSIFYARGKAVCLWWYLKSQLMGKINTNYLSLFLVYFFKPWECLLTLSVHSHIYAVLYINRVWKPGGVQIGTGESGRRQPSGIPRLSVFPSTLMNSRAEWRHT